MADEGAKPVEKLFMVKSNSGKILALHTVNRHDKNYFRKPHGPNDAGWYLQWHEITDIK